MVLKKKTGKNKCIKKVGLFFPVEVLPKFQFLTRSEHKIFKALNHKYDI